MTKWDDILTPNPKYKLTGEGKPIGDFDRLLTVNPKAKIDLPPQLVGTQEAADRLPLLQKQKIAAESPFFKTDEDYAKIAEIEQEINSLTVPMFRSDEFYRMMGEQSEGIQQAMAPWELFFGFGAGFTIAKLGATTLKGALIHGVTRGGVLAATDIPIEVAATAAGDVNPWFGLAVGVGLSIPMGLYADTRLERFVFRQILYKNPKFFSENLSKIVSVNTKLVSAKVKARLEVLKSRMNDGDYAAFIESQKLIRDSIYTTQKPVKLSKLPSEDLRLPSRKQLNKAALKKSFADVQDKDLEDIQALAQVDGYKGFEDEFAKIQNRVNNKLSLEVYRDHPITSMTEAISREGGFSERQLVSMIGGEATATLKARFPRLVAKTGPMRSTDTAVAIIKKIAPDVKVKVIKTPHGLPERIKKQQAAAGRTHMGVRGSYNKKLKELHLVESTLKDSGDAALTGIHEILHSKILKHASMFDEVYASNKQSIDKMARSLKMKADVTATEEWLVRQISNEMLFQQGAFSFSDFLKEGVKKRTMYHPEMAKPNIIKHLGLKGQVNPIHKAVAYGYNSVEEMLYDFMQAPTLGKIRRSINSQMQHEWDQIFLDDYATRAGGAELKMWEKIGGKKLVQRTRAAARRDAELIGTKPKLLRDIINEVNFIRKVGVHAVRATMRTLKAEARLTQLARADALKESVKQRAAMGKIGASLKNSLRDGGIPYDYQVQVHNFLDPYVKGAIVEGGEQLSIREFLQTKIDDGVPVVKLLRHQYEDILDLPTTVLNTGDLTLDQFRKMDKFIKDLRKIGHKERVVDKIAAKQTVNEFVAPMKQTADKTFKRKMEDPSQRQWLLTKSSKIRNSRPSKTDFRHKLFAQMKRAENILREIDAWDEFGPAQKVFMTAKLAEDSKFQIAKVIRERWETTLNDYAKSLGKRSLGNRFWNKTYKDSIVKDFGATREKMITMAGMTGNPHNKAAMLNSIKDSASKPLGEVLLNRFLRENMTTEDWSLVKGIWKMTDEMYDMLNDVHKRMRNAPLPKVTNYWPIIPDYFFGKKAPKQSLEDVFMDMPHLKKLPRTLQKGFFKPRVGNSDAIRMDFSGLAKHFRDVSHTVSHWEATDDIRKVIDNRIFRDTVEANLGKPKYNVLKQWYEDLVQPAPVDSPGFRRLRANVTVAALGLKVSTALVQPASAISAVPRVGALNLVVAYAEANKNPRRFIRSINEVSEQMAGRDNAWQRDIGELLDTAQMKKFRKMGQLDRNMFFGFIRTADKIGAYPVWYAGYMKAMRKYGGDTNKAIMFADKSVRLTQPQSSLKDLPNIMKGPEWKRSITMFYSYYNVLMNQTTELMQRARFDPNMRWWDVASALNWMYIVPPIAISIAKEREVNPEEITKNVATHLAGGLPIVRDVISSAVKGYDYTLSPVGDVFEVGAAALTRIGTAAMDVAEGDFEFEKGDLYIGFKAAGYGLGVPSAQALTMTNGLIDYYNYEDVNILDIMLKRTESKKE